MDIAKKTRKVQRSLATKLLKQVEEETQCEQKNQLKINVLQIQLEEKRKELKDLDKEIIKLNTDESADFSSEMEAAEMYQTNLIEGLQKLELYAKKTRDGNDEQRIQNKDDDAVKTNADSFSVRLPKLQLPQFSGDINLWTSFWQTFEATVHEKKNLSAIEKLTLLVSLLHGEAAKTVSGFALTAENYPDVIDVLRTQYGNKERLVENNVRRILNLKPVKDITQLRALKELVIELTTQLRNLKNLGVGLGENQEVLNSKIKDIIPNEILLLYERQKGSSTSTEELIKFLQTEIQYREAANILTPLNPDAPPYKPKSSATPNGRPTFTPSTHFLPRAGLNRPRQWDRSAPQFTPRAPQWVPRAPHFAPRQQHVIPRAQRAPVNGPNRSGVPTTFDKACFKCGSLKHLIKNCNSK